MDGRLVVTGLLGLAALTAALFWKIGLDVQAEVQQQAAEVGVPQLSREEAAERVAREDMFGLPSRMEDAPHREIERAFVEGTMDRPFPADAAGIATLFDVYAVSIKGCRSQLLGADKALPELLVYVTLKDVGGVGRVAAVDGFGEGTTTQAFTACLDGGLKPAIFAPPTGGEKTISHRLKLK